MAVFLARLKTWIYQTLHAIQIFKREKNEEVQPKPRWRKLILLSERLFYPLPEPLLYLPWLNGTIQFLHSHACQFPVDTQVERLATVIDKMPTSEMENFDRATQKLKWVANGHTLNNPSATSNWLFSFQENTVVGKCNTWCHLCNSFIKMSREQRLLMPAFAGICNIHVVPAEMIRSNQTHKTKHKPTPLFPLLFRNHLSPMMILGWSKQNENRTKKMEAF